NELGLYCRILQR
ncbi:unnamed protein product, partial [Allacma fusca]